jgi:hypothetical protein
MSGGSSSPSPTTTTTGLAALPDWAQGYAKDAISNAASLTNINTNPYQQYDAQRIADFSPMQQQAQQGAANMQTSGAIGVGQDMAQAAGISALGTGYNASNYGSQFNPQGIGYGAQNTQAASLGYAPQISAGQYGTPLMDTAQTGYNPNLQMYQMGPAERVQTQSFAQPGAADAYMSPYMQNVVDIQKREAQRQSGIQGTQQQAQAVGAGAFGGSRDAIQRAERERNLNTQMGDIQAQGSQAAYQQAQQQFNAEQQARLAAQQANQQAGITVGGQNLGAALGVQQLGSQTGLQTSLANLSSSQQANVQNQAAQLQMQGLNAQQAMQAALANQQTQSQYGLQQGQLTQQANLANQAAQNQAGQFNAGQNLQAAGLGAQYGQAANQLNEQSRQYGAGLGLQGLQTGLQAAGQLGALGQNEYTQNMGINQLQGQYGAQQQAQQQQGLTQSYQDFLNQQNYPYKQMGFMSDMLRGLPLGQQSTQSIYQAPPSAIQNIGALGMGAYGAKQLGMFAEGGQVDSYADGGDINSMDDPNAMTAAVAKLSDEQLQQIIQRPSSAAELQAAKLELATRASEKSGLAGAYNMQNQAPEAPSMAQGGMVAFAHGGIPRYAGKAGSMVYEDDAVDDGFRQTPDGLYVAADEYEDKYGGGDEDYSKGNESLYNRFGKRLEKALNDNDAVPSISLRSDQQMEDAALARFGRLNERIGGDKSYTDIQKQIADMRGENEGSLREGRGLAALQAAGAMLQGNDPIRGIGAAGSAFASSYAPALAAKRRADQSFTEMNINLAKAQRAEKAGLLKEADMYTQNAEANKINANKAATASRKAGLEALAQAAKAYRPQLFRPAAAARPNVDALAQEAFLDAAQNPDDLSKKQKADSYAKMYGLSKPAVAAAGVTQVGAGERTAAQIAADEEKQRKEIAEKRDAARLLLEKEVDASLTPVKLMEYPEYAEAMKYFGRTPPAGVLTPAEVREKIKKAEVERRAGARPSAKGEAGAGTGGAKGTPSVSNW